MAKMGVVTQNQAGVVHQCTLSKECRAAHEGIPAKKNCLLSVDHGDRCQAWDDQKWTWLIHPDVNQIQQL